MNILQAQPNQRSLVETITKRTIKEIYPHYYPKGAVKFFLDHHNSDRILQDIQDGIVYLIFDHHEAVGTITIKENTINRLFVLPNYQKKGFGKKLLDYAEDQIAKKYDLIQLDASLPAKSIYLHRGYQEIQTCIIQTEYDDVLCYDIMQKPVAHSNSSIHYDGVCFFTKANTDNGEVNTQTLFHYHQNSNMIWADYAGGQIIKGYLIGTTDTKGNLSFSYQHLNKEYQLRMGTCHSVPVILEDGRIELHESWQWLNGDETSGTSILSEYRPDKQ